MIRKQRVVITPEIINQIFDLRNKEYSYSAIAQEIGIVPQSVYNILKKYTIVE
jgi:DNA invertase Pin-like site-specific DNA recombinase